jgi:hypothetical protein
MWLTPPGLTVRHDQHQLRGPDPLSVKERRSLDWFRATMSPLSFETLRFARTITREHTTKPDLSTGVGDNK